MKKKNYGVVWIILGVVPYVLLLALSINSIFNGINSCAFEKMYGCTEYTGLKGFAETWYLALYIFFPVFLVLLLFIILGLSKAKLTFQNRSRLFLTFGLAPFLLALFLLIFACMVQPEVSISSLFRDIFMRHFFVVISEVIGIIFILIGLKGFKTKKKKDI